MSRIRPVKPETWTSDTLHEVSIPAMVTFLAMTNHADDHGRHRDNAAIVYGLIWPMRGEMSAVEVEDHLLQLENAGAICRYTGCDGRRYFHYPTWFKHQKIDKPSLSRLPACPHHAPERCGVCKGPCSHRGEDSATSPGALTESPRALDRPSRPASKASATGSAAPTVQQEAPVGLDDASDLNLQKTAGQKHRAGNSPNPPGKVGEGSAPGSRILDPGSSFPTGRTAPAATISPNQLVGEYVAACDERPPSDVIGHLGRITKKLLAEGIAPEHIRAGLQNFAANPRHPSVLTSMVNEAMNSRSAGLARPGIRPNVPAHQAWTNPVDAAAAYAEEL
ncbi:hypothetical protein [Streptomyces acidiscabies]|uniref:Helix-turn-helix DNA binding domain protein n=1 Tax=Streptomyces acidiscabies TaxID=42234 RepID=A0A0L0KL47_9ACTN|nr:hypothetical protein [Streptomyces acidiscabies]KND38294.1 hypothetical protein IQ63_08010 [Streptomyces acidiscabies]